jgi:Arm DNA-binding domain
MAKVRKRVWTVRSGEQHVGWVAGYFAPGPDGKRQRHSKTFKTRREATAWLANTFKPLV